MGKAEQMVSELCARNLIHPVSRILNTCRQHDIAVVADEERRMLQEKVLENFASHNYAEIIVRDLVQTRHMVKEF